MQLIQTYLRLKFIHIEALGRIVWKILYEDARFLYIILNDRKPVISEYEQVEDQVVKINRYHTRYEGTAREA